MGETLVQWGVKLEKEQMGQNIAADKWSAVWQRLWQQYCWLANQEFKNINKTESSK